MKRMLMAALIAGGRVTQTGTPANAGPSRRGYGATSPGRGRSR
jgi:hypothetical protein